MHRRARAVASAHDASVTFGVASPSHSRPMHPITGRAALRLCTFIAWLLPAILGAQQAPQIRSSPASEPGAGLTVYLMTMGPGDAVWEKFGHNAIWIRDTTQGIDAAWNWGLFDFNDADFLPRFLKGSMRYWMGGYAGIPTVEAYAGDNRSVWAQELALTPAQKQELLDFVRWNARPENRYYHYDYFLDNCSTRVRDALDRVLGGQIQAALDTIATGTTYRWHTRRLTQGSLPVYTGMDIVLGPRGDQPLSAWEESFLPMSLRDYIRPLTVAGPAGARIPLVQRELELFDATRIPEPARPANLLPGFLAVGVLVGGLFAYGAKRLVAGRRGGRLGVALLGPLWSLLAGVIGTVMTLSWLVTDHIFMYHNENLLQLSPLSFLLVPLLISVGLGGRRAELAWRVAAAIAALSVLGLLLQLMPGLDQTNGEVIALALPVHLGIAWGTRLLASFQRSAAAPLVPITAVPVGLVPAPAGAAATGTPSS